MNSLQFRSFLDLLMVSDPWPLDEPAKQRLVGFAEVESQRRGFSDWIEAYHYHWRGSMQEVITCNCDSCDSEVTIPKINWMKTLHELDWEWSLDFHTGRLSCLCSVCRRERE